MEGVLSYEMLCDMKKLATDVTKYITPEASHLLSSRTSYMGIDIHSSRVFPFEQPCVKCGGTGVGRESTFCQKCSGAGRNRYEGMVRNGSQTIILTTKLARKFDPSFPKGLIPPQALARGLT